MFGNTFSVVMTALLLVLMALTMIWKNDKLNAALLVALIARYVLIYLL